jgi:hypothetical protein
MRKTTARIGVGVTTLGLALAGAPALAGGGHHGHGHDDDTLTTVTALDGPRGIDALGRGVTLVTETGGDFSLVIEKRHQPAEVIPLGNLPTDFPPAIAKGPHGSIYLLTGAAAPPEEEAMRKAQGEPAEPMPAAGATLFKWRPGWDSPLPVADIAAYQAVDTDPYDLEGVPEDSNPFGLAALRDGSVLVADAAGNDLLRVWPKSGDIETVARLMPRLVEVPEGLPGPPPDPNAPPPPTEVEAEAVATSVTVGKDGYWYVGELRGFPATPGTSQVWRIKPGSVDAVCDPENPYSGDCKRYADGLTSITDLAAGHRGIYALELSKLSWLQFEMQAPDSEIGGLFLIKRHHHHTHNHELVPDQLITPGGVDVSDRIYIVGPLFGPGALMKIS